MRSPIGSILVILGLATTLVLVLVLFQTIGLRGDLERLQGELAAVRAQALTSQADALDGDELESQLQALETDLQDWLTANRLDGSAGSPGSGGSAGDDQVLDRLDQVLDRIDALDGRLDQICESVPIC